MTSLNDQQPFVLQIVKHADSVAAVDTKTTPSEPELQVNFYKLTKLWLPPEARRQFELLLAEYGFTVQELSRSIKAGYLEWDHDIQQFKAKNIKLLLGFFYFIVLFIALDFSMTFLNFIHQNPVNQWPNNAIVIINMLLYLVIMLTYGRYTIWPARPLSRLRASLASMYRLN